MFPNPRNKFNVSEIKLIRRQIRSDCFHAQFPDGNLSNAFVKTKKQNFQNASLLSKKFYANNFKVVWQINFILFPHMKGSF